MFDEVEANIEELAPKFGHPDKIEYRPVYFGQDNNAVSMKYRYFFNFQKIAENEEVGLGGDNVRSWIEENCNGNVACYIFIYNVDDYQTKHELDILAFTNEEDAAAFKLKWC